MRKVKRTLDIFHNVPYYAFYERQQAKSDENVNV